METGWIVALTGAAATLLTATIAALKFRRERLSAEASNLETILGQRDKAIARESAALEETKALHRELEAASEKIRSLEDRLRRLEAMLPWALDSLRVLDLETERALLEEAAEPWGLSSASDGGKLTWANAAACRVFGLSLDVLLATPWQQLVHPEDLATMASAEARAMRSASSRQGHTGRYRCGDGWRMLTWYFGPYRNGVARWRFRDHGEWRQE